MIVRELITKLGFQFDRTNLDKFQNSVIGFKTKVTLAAAAVAVAINKTLQAFTDLSNAGLSIKDIADAAGLATSELYAMRSAAQQFGLSTENFDEGFTHLSKSITEALHGFGELRQLSQQSGGRVRLPSQFLDQATNFKNAFDDIIEFVDSLDSRSEKLHVLGNIFGVKQAGDWLRFLEQGRDVIEQQVERNRENGKQLESQIDGMKEFKKTIGESAVIAERLYRNLASGVLPVLNAVLKVINAIADRATPQKNAFGLLGMFGGGVLDFAFDKLVPETSNISSNNARESNITNNNNIEISVPPGTSQEQTVFLAEEMTKMFTVLMQQQSREIINNNPMAENGP